MTFLLPAALAVGLFVAAPIIAHFLRRGRAREIPFAAAVLVPQARSVARQRARLEDRWLLALRALMILALAVLGASPLMQCSRLSVARPGGASLALAIVVDDSLSMRAQTQGGKTRWEIALEGARELLASAREGDAVALVLAGQPSRLTLSATTDLGAVSAALDELTPSDRSTDVASALRLARTTLDALPHVEKRIVLLSDLALEKPLDAAAAGGTLVPLPELREPFDNCGIAEARIRTREVEVALACSPNAPLADRRLELVAPAGSEPRKASRKGNDKKTAEKSGARLDAERVLADVKLEGSSLHGLLTLHADPLYQPMQVRLTGSDAIAEDDTAPVIPAGHGLVVGVVADPAKASVQTGGPTVVEMALRALDTGARLEPLGIVSEDDEALEHLGALILDDPAGLTPEVREALGTWVKRGGVALALWGPGVERTPLGSAFDPFLPGAPVWEPTEAPGIDEKSAGLLGEPGKSLLELAPHGRIRLAGAIDKDSRVLVRWSDGEPWLVERPVGRGLALSVGLPASVSQSDFALRPGFLAVLELAIQKARSRRGGLSGLVGTAWDVTPGTGVEGPDGPVEVRRELGEEESLYVQPPVRGRYEFSHGDGREERFATLDPAEIVRQPRPAPEQMRAETQQAAVSQVDISREVASLLLLLTGLELVGRAWLKRRSRTPAARSASA